VAFVFLALASQLQRVMLKEMIVFVVFVGVFLLMKLAILPFLVLEGHLVLQRVILPFAFGFVCCWVPY
jgi:hypothetical protein